jgi:hypothetical protein
MNYHYERSRGSVLSGFKKRWHSKFSKVQWPLPRPEVEALEDERKAATWTNDIILQFMQDGESATPSCMVNTVVDFCRGADLRDIDKHVHGPGQTAWLDDTEAQPDVEPRDFHEQRSNTFTPPTPFEQQSRQALVHRISRSDQGFLNLFSLYKALQEKV